MSGHKKSGRSPLEMLMLVIAVVEPLATIPQIIQVWTSSQVSGVSLPTWIFYTFTSAAWMVYGLKTKDRPLALSGSLWMVTQALVAIGVIVRT